jgi:hypothetical protein
MVNDSDRAPTDSDGGIVSATCASAGEKSEE